MATQPRINYSAIPATGILTGWPAQIQCTKLHNRKGFLYGQVPNRDTRLFIQRRKRSPSLFLEAQIVSPRGTASQSPSSCSILLAAQTAALNTRSTLDCEQGIEERSLARGLKEEDGSTEAQRLYGVHRNSVTFSNMPLQCMNSNISSKFGAETPS